MLTNNHQIILVPCRDQPPQVVVNIFMLKATSTTIWINHLVITILQHIPFRSLKCAVSGDETTLFAVQYVPYRKTKRPMHLNDAYNVFFTYTSANKDKCKHSFLH